VKYFRSGHLGEDVALKKTISQAPISQGVIKRHAGKWVALRGRRVAASAVSYQELQGNPRVRDSDAVYHVPPSRTAHFVATRSI
jgi:hypothetical protein